MVIGGVKVLEAVEVVAVVVFWVVVFWVVVVWVVVVWVAVVWVVVFWVVVFWVVVFWVVEVVLTAVDPVQAMDNIVRISTENKTVNNFILVKSSPPVFILNITL